VTLSLSQIPSHNHSILTASASQGGAVAVPANNTVLADVTYNPTPATTPFPYLPFNNTTPTALAANSIQPTGGSQPHDNMQPFLTINFIIALFGVFPTQT